MQIELRECDLHLIKFGEGEAGLSMIDLLVYSHPKCNLYWKDDEESYKYENYKDAFVTFSINYN